MASKNLLILDIVATDSSFSRSTIRGEPCWLGKCLHCGSKLAVGLDGRPLGDVTIEHLLPRSHGGGDDLRNVALACSRCNQEKGIRHDRKRRMTSRSVEVIESLLRKRAERWRDPPA